ncbi:MAG: uroporphyrinogen-III synthase [Acidobacteria bacterium]|nr:uroporphyrinogen-III synthase [Acidobacteriota bacterium]
MNVVVTREPPRNDDLRTVLSLAVNVDEVPATETRRFDPDVVAATCDIIPGTLVVTSSRAVDAALAVAGKYPTVNVVAVGDVTAERLREAGLTTVTVADDEGVRGLDALDLRSPVVSVGAMDTRPELAILCRDRGLRYEHLVAYDTLPRQLTGEERAVLSRADVVIVAAPSAWAVVGPFVRPEATVIVRGETTANAVRQQHATVVVARGDTATVAATLSALFRD